MDVFEAPGVGLQLSDGVCGPLAVAVIPRVIRQQLRVVAEAKPVGSSRARGVFPFGLSGQAIDVAIGKPQGLAFLLGKQGAIIHGIAPGDVINGTL